ADCIRARQIPRAARSSRRRNANAEPSQAFDSSDQEIARNNGPDTCRRSREHEIARQQLVVLRQEMQDVRHIPDHGAEIALLPRLTVDVQRDAAAARMTDL